VTRTPIRRTALWLMAVVILFIVPIGPGQYEAIFT
jgi:hypothetical protein